jgi:hypothetical protein
MYKLGKNPTGNVVCVRIIDGQNIKTIPFNPDNTDYQEYLKWVEAGNTPEPADEPADE